MTTIYNHNGLRTEMIDNEAIALHAENINAELTAMEEVE